MYSLLTQGSSWRSHETWPIQTSQEFLSSLSRLSCFYRLYRFSFSTFNLGASRISSAFVRGVMVLQHGIATQLRDTTCGSQSKSWLCMIVQTPGGFLLNADVRRKLSWFQSNRYIKHVTASVARLNPIVDRGENRTLQSSRYPLGNNSLSLNENLKHLDDSNSRRTPSNGAGGPTPNAQVCPYRSSPR